MMTFVLDCDELAACREEFYSAQTFFFLLYLSFLEKKKHVNHRPVEMVDLSNSSEQVLMR